MAAGDGHGFWFALLMAVRDTARDLGRPGVGTPHHRAMTFVGHAVLAAAFVEALGLVAGLLSAIAVAVIYGLAKERNDVRRGGRVADSIEDTLGVAAGGLYGFVGWPIYITAIALGIMILSRLRK